MDTDLRIALWNVITEHYWSGYVSPLTYSKPVEGSNLSKFATALYGQHYKLTTDTIPTKWPDFVFSVRKMFFESDWHRVYALVEFIADNSPELRRNSQKLFIDACNKVFEKENSAYRFLAGMITPITSPEEIDEIEKAIAGSDQYAGVRTHLQTSLGFLTDRNNPDYRNSIKESISAVESLAKKLVGDDKATLGQALKVLEKKHNLHPSLKTAFSALYGYTNDADGIRHSLMDNESQLTNADARFMLICCSAFINFAIDSVED